MKQVFLIIICLLFLTGCQSQTPSIDDKYVKQYQNYVQKINEFDEYEQETTDFSIRLVINQMDEGDYRYDIIIDSVNINMYYIQAIAKVENASNDNLPTLGILEENNYSLIPGHVDKENGYYKGINLSMIVQKKDISVNVYITYYDSINSDKKIERYFKLDGNAS